MDKIFSTRLDQDVIVELDRVTRRTGMTKKHFLEEAIRQHARRIDASAETDVWTETFGSWRRKESTTSTIRKARSAFRQSLERHKK